MIHPSPWKTLGDSGLGAIVYAELDGTNQLIARYLHGDEFDQTFTRVLVDGSTPQVHWLLTDHLNSVRLVLNESGAVLDQIACDAFGNIVAQLNPTTGVVGSLFDNPSLLTSQEFDFKTGLYHHRVRYSGPFCPFSTTSSHADASTSGTGWPTT